MDTSSVLQLAIIGLVILGGMLWILPSECKCAKCSFHVNERRMNREVKRERDHRTLHSTYNIPWGSQWCTHCRDGHEDDRQR